MDANYQLDAINDTFDGDVALQEPASTLPAPAAREIWMAEERLPFTVNIVRSEQQLHQAVFIRQAAYARHVPAFAEKLRSPEPYDRADGSIVLLAESKMDGTPLGTMRIQTNRFRDLVIQQSVDLPETLQNCRLAEATRLGIAEGRVGRVVKATLFKAFYQYCLDAKIDWMVIAARPPLDRQYDAMLFEDLYGGQYVPMRHGNNIPHRVLGLEIATAESRWAAANHPQFHFMVQTYHPDVDLSDGDFSDWSPRIAVSQSSNCIAAIA